MHRFLLFVLVLLPAACFVCQPDTALGEVFDYLYDFRGPDNGEIESYDYLFENDRININTAPLKILMQLPGIDYATAERIIDERRKNGRFFSLAELLNIEGLDKSQVSSLLPHIVLIDENRLIISRASADSSSLHKIKVSLKSGFSLKQTEDAAEYPGPDYRQYNKLKLSGENWRASVMTEKDPGEEQFDDFKSFYVHVKNGGVLNTFTAGDYYIEFGQGLTMWSPSMKYLRSGPAAYARSARGTVPAGGFNESDFLRGCSLELKYKRFSVTGFISKAGRDAEKDSAGIIVFFPEGGYHRTRIENSRKGSSTEQLYGIIARYSADSIFSAGLLLNSTEFDSPVKMKGTQESIKSVFSAGADYRINFQKLFLGGEVNFKKGSLSISNSISYRLSDKTNILIDQTSVGMINKAFFKTSFDMPSDVLSMKAIQIGVRSEVINGVLYLSYGYRTEKRSGGKELFSKEGGLSFSASPGKSVYGYLKMRVEDEKYTENGAVLITSRKMLLNSRADITWHAGNKISIHCRGSYCLSYENEMQKKAEGLAFLHGIKIRLYKELFISTCLTVYNTGSYASRLYELEKDAGGFLYSSLLYGKGIKWYIVADIPFGANAGISVKYADDTKRPEKYADKEGVLSENNRLNFQFHYTF